MKIKVINRSRHALPNYATAGSAGMDVRALLDEELSIGPLERVLVPTGIYMQLPVGFEAQIRPRSGLSLKGISVANSPGTIDSDYRGEVKIILINLSGAAFKINDGDRVAQMVINRYERAEWESVETLDETSRGEGGFGHTGSN